MRTSLRVVFSAIALSLVVPAAVQAQTFTCPPGYTFTQLPGGGFSCVPTAPAAPEIGLSSSVTGLAVLLAGGLMLRGRKRRVAMPVSATI